MKKVLLFVAATLAMASVFSGSVPAQTVTKVQTGFRLFDGKKLNEIIDHLNGASTGAYSGTFTGSGAFTAVTGTDSSLGVTGQAAAQGGAVAAVGGTSSTAGNAGGAITMVGGTPGVTGVGGAVSGTGGAGGATSGAGGAVSLRGGAGTAGNAAGGAASLIGGAGQGSAAGGAIAVTGGAGGATGLGGAVAIASGAPTAGAGTDVTVTASAGAVTATSAGGSINLVPGAAVTTGIPGTIKVNGDSNLMCGTYFFTGTPAATSQVFYLATRPMMVTSISEVHSVAAGGTSTLDVTKDTTTGAPASGSVLTSAAFNLASTANTVQAGAVTATVATKTLAAGDRLSVKFNHAIQSSAGVVVTACMAPL